MFLLIFSFLHAHQLRFTFRLAFRRSFSSSYYCDQNTIGSRSLLGSGGSSYAKCNYCSSTTIVSTGFRCTDYRSNEDWSMGENNFNYTFSFYNRWVVTYIPLFNAFFILRPQFQNHKWLLSSSSFIFIQNVMINLSPVKQDAIQMSVSIRSKVFLSSAFFTYSSRLVS